MAFFDLAKKRIRKRIGPPLQKFGYTTGVMQFAARIMRIEGAVALMYHSVARDTHVRWIDPRNHVPLDVFESQMAFLAEHKRVIRLSELIAGLQQGETPEKGTVVITFDDGYIDNLHVASQVLDRNGLNATIFLPTNYIDRGETPWVDQAYGAFRLRTKSKISWGEDNATRYDLDNLDQYAAGYRVVCKSLLDSTGERRRVLLDRLYEYLQPSESPPRLTMTWDDVMALLSKHRCFEIGGHSEEHSDLTRVAYDDARRELIGCARKIEDKIGVRPKHFSFPYGRTSRQLRELVAEVGFESAFGSAGSDPIINASTDLYALPRVEAPRFTRGFDLVVSTANTGVWRRLGR